MKEVPCMEDIVSEEIYYLNTELKMSHKKSVMCQIVRKEAPTVFLFISQTQAGQR
jgi:hypothetical protein